MFLINSRSAAFAAPRSLTEQGGHLANLRPAVLPSSLRIVLSIACVYSTRPPVLVYSTVSSYFHYENFPENKTLLTFGIVTHFYSSRSIFILLWTWLPWTGPSLNGPSADFPTLAHLLLTPLSTIASFFRGWGNLTLSFLNGSTTPISKCLGLVK